MGIVSLTWYWIKMTLTHIQGLVRVSCTALNQSAMFDKNILIDKMKLKYAINKYVYKISLILNTTYPCFWNYS